MRIKISVIFLFFFIIISSCRKDTDFPSTTGTLAFSADTLTFDTVFTTVGSITGSFKVYNPNNKKVKISSIFLGGRQNSNFRINVDGTPVNTEVKDIEIAGKDSMYVFVKVTVDPNNQNNPLIITDSVIFETNGILQDVKVIAWGQDANFFVKDTLSCNTTWTKDKPYVVMNYVLVDSGCTLTIDKGTRVYLHSGAIFLVKGTLIVNGIKGDSVVFQGDRLEQFFTDVPGQWGGIYFLRSSKGNHIHHAVIKNAVDGIVAGFWENNPDFTVLPNVRIHYTVIKNIYGSGIIGLFADMTDVYNCLIYNCGQNGFTCLGGKYNFAHCTFANFGSNALEHKTALFGLSNYSQSLGILAVLDAVFTNCIIYGSLEEEIDTFYNNGANINYLFENCLLKTKRNYPFVSSEKNKDPLFKDLAKEDFHLQNNSPAKDEGKITTITNDLDDKLRDDGNPDIGCYEYKP